MTVAEDSVAFFAMGDWGGLPIWPYRTNIQTNTAKSLDQLSSSLNSRFQLLLGDNFYFKGVKNADDKRFAVNFLFCIRFFFDILIFKTRQFSKRILLKISTALLIKKIVHGFLF